MTEMRRQQVNAASNRYYQRMVAKRWAAGLTSRGTPRKYKLWAEPGLPRFVRARMERRYEALGKVMEETAAFGAQCLRWLPADLRTRAVALVKKWSAVKRFNPKRKVRVK